MGGQSQPMSRWPLTGRDDELETFTTAWADRHCQGVVIYGSPGTGKSRLAEECLAWTAQQGWKARRATASAAAAAVPLGAIAHLIPPWVDLSDPVKGFAETAAALAGPQRDRRWAVWVDDLHLLDVTSAVLLQQLAETGTVRLIATVRTGEPVSEAVHVLADRNGMQRIDLEVFDSQQTEAVMTAALNGPMGYRALQEFQTASGGNALYLHELVLGALQAGTLANDGEIWQLVGDEPMNTPRLTELIGSRLAAAGTAGRPVLELLALCGSVPFADVKAIAPPVVLTDLEHNGFIRTHLDRRRSAVTLGHPLYGEVLRAKLPLLRRRALLLQQAERVKAHGARRRDDALHIATWHLAASGTADPTLLVRAATLARHAHDYDQVIALLQSLPEQHRTFTTRLLHGEALLELGDWEKAETILAEADASTVHERDKLVVTIIRSMNMFWIAARTTDAFAVTDSARTHVISPVGRHVLEVYEAFMNVVSSQPARGVTLLGGLEANIKDAPEPNAWLLGVQMKAAGLAMLGRTGEAMACAEQGYAAHQEMDQQAIIPHPASQLVSMTIALTEAGRFSEARETGERAFADLLAARAPGPRAWAALHLARTEWLAGHITTARHWYAEATALARTHQPRATPLALSGLAACMALAGDAEAAHKAATQARKCAFMGLLAGEEQLGEAWTLAAQGQLRVARSILLEAAGHARATGYVTSEALLLTDVARLGGAGEVAGRLADLAKHTDGAFSSARACLVAALAVEDPEQLLAASDQLETIGADLLAAEAAAAASAAWQKSGHPRHAAAATRRANACTTRCQGARSPLLTTTQTAFILTEREREVTLLAAAGTPSKEIAAALHLSVRTVDNHLQRAYTKLGVTTRRELAAALDTKTIRLAVQARSRP